MHKEFVKAFCILFVSQNKPQVLWCSASPVAQVVWGAETIAQASTCRQAAHEPCRVLLCQALGSWALPQAGGTSELQEDQGKGWRSWEDATQMNCYPLHRCIGWKTGRAGGKWQSSELLSCVYEGLNICAVDPRTALNVRGSLQTMDVCQVIQCWCLRVGDLKMYFQRKEIWGQIMTWQWLPLEP